MKKIKSVLVCGLLLAFAGVSTMVLAEGAKHSTMAMVRAMHGSATYTVDNGAAMPLHVNSELPEGATITTGPDSRVDLQVNGHTSVVRITENSRMSLKTMQDLGGGDSETMLNIDNGLVLGRVKKITKDSTYEIQTPRGVAGIRGTDWAVQVTQQANGNYTVTFTSQTGDVFVVANVSINGVITQVPKTLTDGQSWTPPDQAPSAEAAVVLTAEAANIVAAFEGMPSLMTITVTTTGVGNIVTIVPHVVSASTIGGNASTQSSGGEGEDVARQ